ncbi:hypothetical protein ACFQ22_02220 [Lentilactobacillus raoultii]|uniref:Uncharacterized protein n=1 Tax=Lentilactobacillus raoultii TaxID=1987503 RepID=A0ABW3PDF9_9LACO|nr:hypothetical protein [Lentilactobacillus raoultii]
MALFDVWDLFKWTIGTVVFELAVSIFVILMISGLFLEWKDNYQKKHQKF